MYGGCSRRLRRSRTDWSQPAHDTSCVQSTGIGPHRAALPPPPRVSRQQSVLRRAHRGRAHAPMRTAPGRAFDGAAGARESTSDVGETWLVTHPVLHAGAAPTCNARALGPPSAIAPVFEVESPAPRLLFPVRPAMVWVWWSSFSKRATFASSRRTFEWQGISLHRTSPRASSKQPLERSPARPRLRRRRRQMGAIQAFPAKDADLPHQIRHSAPLLPVFEDDTRR